ncbi:hypothetical protein DEI83_04850 [Curtobacterium sp. MCBD17_021]|nr:hypothetical protein DEI83_04850 [Curtobacterium sp. MCBD17_021]
MALRSVRDRGSSGGAGSDLETVVRVVDGVVTGDHARATGVVSRGIRLERVPIRHTFDNA